MSTRLEIIQRSLRSGIVEMTPEFVRVLGTGTIRLARDGDLYSLLHSGKVVSRFCISLLPGCGTVAVFHGVVVEEKWRGRGLGSLLHRLRLAAIVEAEVTLVLCTVVSGNTPQIRILERNGWVEGRRFVNNVTGNEVVLFIYAVDAAGARHERELSRPERSTRPHGTGPAGL